MDYTDFVREHFADSDSDEEFIGFTERDLVEGNNNETMDISEESDSDGEEETSTAHGHAWLMDYNTSESGPRNIAPNPTELDTIRFFLIDELLELLVKETNRYAEQFLQSNSVASPFAKANKWKPTTINEMKSFIAILLLIGLTKRSSYELYWSTDPLITMNGFRNIMPRERFLNILSFLHLVDNDQALPREHPNYDKAFKIQPLIDILVPL